MTRQDLKGAQAATSTTSAQRLTGIVLVRIAVGGDLESDIARDVLPLLGAKASPEIWRIEVGRLVAALIAGELIERRGDTLAATPLGHAAAAEFLGSRKALATGWAAIREIALMAKALDIGAGSPSRLKLVGKADGLKALIIIQNWGLKIKGSPSASRLRSALAVKALERAFGNQMRSGLGDKSALPAKAGRLLAGQLSRSGRVFGTDARLVAALAAEAVDAPGCDLASLQLAVLRRFIGRADGVTAEPRRKRGSGRKAKLGAAPVAPLVVVPPIVSPEAAAPSSPIMSPGSIQPEHEPPPLSDLQAVPRPVLDALSPVRPDPDGFARAVHEAADAAAEGWAGNRRAFICKVWGIVQSQHPEWALSEIEFKCMLAEAHRTGLVVLANADLKDKRALKELQASAVTYKNTVWHYVRASG